MSTRIPRGSGACRELLPPSYRHQIAVGVVAVPINRLAAGAASVTTPARRESSRRSARLLGQFIRFLGVGVVSFAVDYGLYVLLLTWLQYLVASSISFTISLILNYVLTLKFVFVARPGRNIPKEFAYFLGLNVIALGFNQAILLFAVELLDFSELGGKIVATAVVVVYNFISRKMLIERSSRRILLRERSNEGPGNVESVGLDLEPQVGDKQSAEPTSPQ